MRDASVYRAGGVVSCFLGSVSSKHDCRVVAIDLIADAALRQDGFLLLELRNRIVAAFHVRPAKARELNRLAAGCQHRDVAAGRFGGNLDVRPKHARVNHL
jgi:hypothetical protein